MKIVLSIVAASALLLVAGCGYQGESAPGPDVVKVTSPSPHVVKVTDANFQEQVLDSSKPVLVDFWATWCRPCVEMAPTINELADDFAGEAVVAKLDVDENQATAAQYEITGIPAMLIFKDGQEVDRIVGTTDKDVLAAKLSALSSK